MKKTALVLALTVALSVSIKNAKATIYRAGYGEINSYSNSGAPISTPLISGLNSPGDIVTYGNDMFISSVNTGIMGKYTLDGDIVNANLITGLSAPYYAAIQYTNIYISNMGNGTIGKYTITGDVINATLINHLQTPRGIAISGNNLFVAAGGVMEYDATTGALISNNNSFIGVTSPVAIAASGDNIFVANYDTDTISKYSTTGTLINSNFISGRGQCTYMCIYGNSLFATEINFGRVAEFDINSGALLNSFSCGGMGGLAVVPEPTGYALFGLGTLVVLIAARCRIA